MKNCSQGRKDTHAYALELSHPTYTLTSPWNMLFKLHSEASMLLCFMIQDICGEKTVLYLCQLIFGRSPRCRKQDKPLSCYFYFVESYRNQIVLPLPTLKNTSVKTPPIKQSQIEKTQTSWGSLAVRCLGPGVGKAKRVGAFSGSLKKVGPLVHSPLLFKADAGSGYSSQIWSIQLGME